MALVINGYTFREEGSEKRPMYEGQPVDVIKVIKNGKEEIAWQWYNIVKSGNLSNLTASSSVSMELEIKSGSGYDTYSRYEKNLEHECFSATYYTRLSHISGTVTFTDRTGVKHSRNIVINEDNPKQQLRYFWDAAYNSDGTVVMADFYAECSNYGGSLSIRMLIDKWNGVAFLGSSNKPTFTLKSIKYVCCKRS